MSGECDKCEEHSIECSCIVENKKESFRYIISQDVFVHSLFEWVDSLELLLDKVSENSNDSEMENKLCDMMTDLKNQIGLRVYSIFRHHGANIESQ